MVLQRIHTQIITSTGTGGEFTCKFVTVDTWGESRVQISNYRHLFKNLGKDSRKHGMQNNGIREF